MTAQWKKEKADILSKGKACAEEIENRAKFIKEAEDWIEDKNVCLSKIGEHLDNLEVEYEKACTAKLELYEKAQSYQPENEELINLQKKRDELKEKVQALQTDEESKASTIRETINDLESKTEPYREIVKKYDYWFYQNETLAKTRQLRANNAKKMAELEQKRELLNRFVFVKLQMLDERVKMVFGNIKFQLIKPNINGGYDPVCKPYIYDVDKDESTSVLWRSGSKSERIVTGIAIAERIKFALGLPDLPFLFDEGGEISTDTFNTKFKTESQLICVKVQDNIKKPMVLKI